MKRQGWTWPCCLLQTLAFPGHPVPTSSVKSGVCVWRNLHPCFIPRVALKTSFSTGSHLCSTFAGYQKDSLYLLWPPICTFSWSASKVSEIPLWVMEWGLCGFQVIRASPGPVSLRYISFLLLFCLLGTEPKAPLPGLPCQWVSGCVWLRAGGEAGGRSQVSPLFPCPSLKLVTSPLCPCPLCGSCTPTPKSPHHGPGTYRKAPSQHQYPLDSSYSNSFLLLVIMTSLTELSYLVPTGPCPIQDPHIKMQGSQTPPTTVFSGDQL